MVDIFHILIKRIGWLCGGAQSGSLTGLLGRVFLKGIIQGMPDYTLLHKVKKCS